jgi:hypothetical protein
LKKKETLFRKSRPHIRQLQVFENGEISADIGILWAAYQRKSFRLNEGMTSKDFQEVILKILSMYHSVWIIEDDNKSFRSGRGPISFIGVWFDGWTIEPHTEYFKWATKRNILRASVAVMQKTRYDKGVGCLKVKSLSNTVNLFHRVGKYIPSFRYVGKVNGGSFMGDEFWFSIKGAKHGWTDGSGAEGLQRTGGRERTTSTSKVGSSPVSGPEVSSVGEGRSDSQGAAGGNGSTG